MSRPPVIAIVDDDEAVREALFDLLQVEGLPARRFAGAAAFLADTQAYGCIVTDLRMPEIDGLELLQRLRERGSETPVIFVTSATGDATRAKAMRCGAFGWFTKPLDDEVLLAAIHAALGISDARQPGH